MLRRHAQFFDTDGDGKITMSNCYTALRSLRLGQVFSAVGAFALPLALGWPSGGSLTAIDVDGMHNIIHAPNDTGGFSQPERTRWDKSSYTLADIKQQIITRGGKSLSLIFTGEWRLTLHILKKFRERKNSEGKDVILREEIERLFDGSLFFALAGREIPPLVEETSRS